MSGMSAARRYAMLIRSGGSDNLTAIALRSVRTWAAVRFTPINSGVFARLATDFTRHCLYRPLNMGRVELHGMTAARPAADLHCALV